MKKAAVVLFLLSLGAVLNLAIPPFQNPDEPLHFATILRFARGEDQNGVVQKEIIRLMDRYGWWRLIGMRSPVARPGRFEEIPFLVGYYGVEDYIVLMNRAVLYHFGLGKVLGPFAGASVVRAYYLARFVSFMFYLGAMALIFLTFRRLAERIAEDRGGYPAWGFLFAAFLPALAVNSMSVSPDALCLFLGSLFFTCAFAILDGGKIRPVHYLFLASAALAGAMVDKSLFALLPLAALVLVFSMNRKNYRNVIVLMLFLSIVLILAIYFLALAFPLQMEHFVLILKTNLRRALSSYKSYFALDPFNREFFGRLVDSFFFRFGWLTFGAGRVVDWVWRGLLIVAGAGTVVWTGRILLFKLKHRLREIDRERKSDRSPDPGPDDKAVSAPGEGAGSSDAAGRSSLRIVVFSMIAVLLQVLAVRIAASPDNIYAQGRYLFPYIVPAAFLFVLGIKTFFDLFAKKGTLVLRAVLVVMFVFLNYVLWGLIVPIFHLTAKSPYPGI